MMEGGGGRNMPLCCDEVRLNGCAPLFAVVVLILPSLMRRTASRSDGVPLVEVVGDDGTSQKTV